MLLKKKIILLLLVFAFNVTIACAALLIPQYFTQSLDTYSVKGIFVECLLFISIVSGFFSYVVIFKSNKFSDIESIAISGLYFLVFLSLVLGVFTKIAVVGFYAFLVLSISMLIVLIYKIITIRIKINTSLKFDTRMRKIILVSSIIMFAVAVIYHLTLITINNYDVNMLYNDITKTQDTLDYYKNNLVLNIIGLIFVVILILNSISDCYLLRVSSPIGSFSLMYLYLTETIFSKFTQVGFKDLVPLAVSKSFCYVFLIVNVIVELLWIIIFVKKNKIVLAEKNFDKTSI